MEETMRRLVVTMILVCTLLPMVSTAAYATPSTEVAGDLDYWFQVTGMREAGPNIFMDATEQEEWRGDMVGDGNSVFTVGMFAAGFWNVWLRCEFEGVVDGKEGTLLIQMVGKKPLGEDWYGQWVILSGTGELANAHGRGTWWGPGYRDEVKDPDSPDCYYSGQIHFDPE
jgi:hypothetical protein